MVFVELCAGSAAVTFHLLGGRCPSPYMGNKRRFAAQIVEALGVGAPDAIALVEVGEWANTLRVLLEHRQHVEVADALQSMWDGGEEARDLFEQFKHAPPHSHPPTRAARHLFMIARNYRAKPIEWTGRRWTTSGFDPEFRLAKNTTSPRSKPRGWCNRRDRLAAKVCALGKLKPIPVAVMAADVRLVAPQSGACVFFDPNYRGATGYRRGLSRADVLDLAERWRSAGSVVGVSEHEPLPLAGAEARPLLLPGRGRRRFGSRGEWLTVARPDLRA